MMRLCFCLADVFQGPVRICKGCFHIILERVDSECYELLTRSGRPRQRGQVTWRILMIITTECDSQEILNSHLSNVQLFSATQPLWTEVAGCRTTATWTYREVKGQWGRDPARKESSAHEGNGDCGRGGGLCSVAEHSSCLGHRSDAKVLLCFRKDVARAAQMISPDVSLAPQSDVTHPLEVFQGYPIS